MYCRTPLTPYNTQTNSCCRKASLNQSARLLGVSMVHADCCASIRDCHWEPLYTHRQRGCMLCHRPHLPPWLPLCTASFSNRIPPLEVYSKLHVQSARVESLTTLAICSGNRMRLFNSTHGVAGSIKEASNPPLYPDVINATTQYPSDFT